jgi:coenzyme F420-dependent glucose-6-phosphate dehydrogenase
MESRARTISPNDLLEPAIAAERAGFDLVEASDHFHPWDESGQASFIWTWLGAAAARTRHIGLGTGVTCPILRYHPATVAQASATFAVMAPNRAYLGIDTGEALNEYAATGLWPEYDERQARMAESIQLIRALWSGERVTHTGAFYATRGAKLYTRPATPPPLYISALVPESAAFAGQYGDGLITVGGKEPELYQRMIQRFEEGARHAGKEPSGMPRLIELNAAYTADRQRALHEMKQYWTGASVPALHTQTIHTLSMSARNGQVVGNDTLERSMVISDRPEDLLSSAQL